MSEQQKVQQQQQQSAAAANSDNNDDNNCSFVADEWSSFDFEGSGAKGGNNSGNCDLVNKLKLNMDTLKMQVKMLQTDQKCAKMEAEMREKSLEQKLQESQEKLEKLSIAVDYLKVGHQLQCQDFAGHDGWLNDLNKKVERLEADFRKNKPILEQNGMDAKKIVVPAWLSSLPQKEQIGQQQTVAVAIMPNQINKTKEILKLLDDTEAIRKRLPFVVANCKKLFATKSFTTNSKSIEALGFQWHLQAQGKQNGTLSLFLYAKPPAHFKGTYRIEIDYRLLALNAFHAKDAVVEKLGGLFNDANSAWGFNNVATLSNLLDPKKGFLRTDGSIEVEADFTIKSATLDHLA